MNFRNFLFIVIAMAHFGVGNGLYAMDNTPTPTSNLWDIILRPSDEPQHAEQDLEDAQQAINNGADIESTFLACTPVMWAVSVEKKFLISLLIRAGANINATTDGESMSPLMLANKTKKNNPIFCQLLEAGANANFQHSHTGDTLLHLIGINDLSLEVAAERLCWLLHYGANTALRNHAGLTPLEQTNQLIQRTSSLAARLTPLEQSNRIQPTTRSTMQLFLAREKNLLLKRDLLAQGTEHPRYQEFLISTPFLSFQLEKMCREQGVSLQQLVSDQQIYGPDARKYSRKFKTLTSHPSHR